MPFRRLAEQLLTEWRALERDLLQVPDDSNEAVVLRSNLAHLRNEYQRLTEEARETGQPEPGPFPTEP